MLALHREILTDNDRDMFVEENARLQVEERRLQEMRRFAEKRTAEHDLWGFKEPRSSLFLAEWKAILPQMKVLVVYRHFAEATRSLAKRHAAEISFGRGTAFDRQLWEKPDLALKSWLAYNEALISFARAHPEDTLTISFDTLRSGFPLVKALNRRWNLGLQEIPTEETLDPTTSIELPSKQRVSDRSLISRTLQTWEALEDLDAQTQQESGFADKKKPLVSEEDFHIPKDATLEAENELLSLQFSFLEDHLKRSEEARKRLRSRLEENENRTSRLWQRLRRAERAKIDLTLLLRKLSKPPLGPILRLKKSFRSLEKRYLKDE